MIKLIEEVQTAFNLLKNNGFLAFLVGGCVRDSLLNKKPKDYDITTNALPEQIKQTFKDYTTIDTGIKYGTIVVVINRKNIEITTFRQESNYLDNRRPEIVKFDTSVNNDLSRRDFTINALAYNKEQGIVDLFNGTEDLKNKVIRCVGDANLRFQEDGLRILRALRFASQLGFEIEEETKKAIFNNKHLLLNISNERIFAELCKLLLGKNVKNILIEFVDVFAVFIPDLIYMKNFEQHSIHHVHDILKHTAIAIEKSKKNLIVRLALLLHDIGKPKTFSLDDKGQGHFYGHAKVSVEIAKKVLKNLRASNYEYKMVVNLIEHHDMDLIDNEKFITRLLNKFGSTFVDYLIEVQIGDNFGQHPKHADRQENFKKIKQIKAEIIKRNKCFSLKQF